MDVILLELPDMEGTSQLSGYEKKIELLSYSHGVAMQVTGDVSNTERTSGRPMHQDFHLTKYVDKTTPLLNQHCCEGKAFATAKITIGRNDAGTVIPLIIYSLTNVVVSSVSVGGGGGDKPVESFSLNYASIKWDFSTQKEAGGKEGTVQGKWDLTTNKAA
ncbi:MAG TPA: type VI secretion system tube protein Hcp [Longimicrobiaceae bacterium]|nr:type VI secretion system tube protein Hcp [Longimicrobiaceae bacterium]